MFATRPAPNAMLSSTGLKLSLIHIYTLFVDKNLRYHGLMQAFSRTNRIYDATQTFGNIVTFRDLEQSTIDAITLFGEIGRASCRERVYVLV